MPVIEGSRCLDLFAGSGALGLEAASRGAAEAVLIESDPCALATLRANVTRLRADKVRIEAGNALTWLRQTPPVPCDIVFVDPPYATDLAVSAITALMDGGWLAPKAWLYTEWPDGRAPPLLIEPWRRARAGAVHFALYRVGSGAATG